MVYLTREEAVKLAEKNRKMGNYIWVGEPEDLPRCKLLDFEGGQYFVVYKVYCMFEKELSDFFGYANMLIAKYTTDAYVMVFKK